MKPPIIWVNHKGGSRRTRLFLWKNMTDIGELENVTRTVLESRECDLVQLTFSREKPGWVLRVLVEKKGSDPRTGSGVDHSLCAGISRELDELLESGNFIDRAFLLEVSSPGIERPLVGENDFVRFAGRRAQVRTKQAIDGRKRFLGNILETDSDGVRLGLKDSKKEVRIPFDSIAKANLVFESELGK